MYFRVDVFLLLWLFPRHTSYTVFHTVICLKSMFSMKAGFLHLGVFIFWAVSFFAVGGHLCTVGCLEASLASTHSLLSL